MIGVQNSINLLASAISPGGLPQPAANDSAVQTALSIALGVAGALAFLMIVISGFRYVLSGSDPQRAGKAKEGIIYSLIGLTLVIIAEAIVTFVVNHL